MWSNYQRDDKFEGYTGKEGFVGKNGFCGKDICGKDTCGKDVYGGKEVYGKDGYNGKDGFGGKEEFGCYPKEKCREDKVTVSVSVEVIADKEDRNTCGHKPKCHDNNEPKEFKARFEDEGVEVKVIVRIDTDGDKPYPKK